MWIIDNRTPFFERINTLSNSNKLKSISTWDFSTMYTSIPHSKLKDVIQKILDMILPENECKLAIGKFFKKELFHKNEILGIINFLIDNIYIQCGNVVFRQVKGIPMGTNCAPFLANLFLFWYEFNWMKDMMRKDMKIAKKMSNTFRYLDDLVSINSDKLVNKYHSKIYPPELEISETTKDNLNADYLDVKIKILRDSSKF